MRVKFYILGILAALCLVGTVIYVRAFVKAWNVKVIPIFLTVVSAILGFIPFMVGSGKEAFWFPLAAGTIGGLIMSVLGIFIFLPIFALKKERVFK